MPSRQEEITAGSHFLLNLAGAAALMLWGLRMVSTGVLRAWGADLRRAIIEVPALPDADADGLPDGLDPYTADPLNGLELRCAGRNGTFGDSDDVVYRLNTSGYAGSTNLMLNVVDGPLQPGLYRFTSTMALADRLGNGLVAPYTRTFTIGDVPGFVVENRNNGSRALATSSGGAGRSLPTTASPPSI